MTKPTDPTRRALLTAGAAASLGDLAATRTMAQNTGASGGEAMASQSRRRLGDLEVSALGPGVQNMSCTFQSTVPDRAAMHEAIRTAFDNGVTFFDTAEVYGPHECERILGEAVAPFRDQIEIVTKFGFDVDLQTGEFRRGVISRPSHIKEAVEESLQRLNTDRVELLYQHRVDPEVPIEDVAGAVGDLINEGKVLHWGLSEMGLDTLRRAHRELPVSAVRNEYSMLWRGPETDGTLALCNDLGIGFVPFSPLGYGFLTGAIDMNTSFAPGDFRAGTTRMDPENRQLNLALLELARAWAVRKDAAPSQIALAWLLAQGPSIVPIPGPAQMPHLLENTGATEISFTAEELEELNRDVAAIEVQARGLPPWLRPGPASKRPRRVDVQETSTAR